MPRLVPWLAPSAMLSLACCVSPPDAPPVVAPTVVLPDDTLANASGARNDSRPPDPLVLGAPPSDLAQALDINFENKVHLVGYRFEPESAAPGQQVQLAFWWRCDDVLEEGWQLFTHTKDEGSGKMGNLDYVGALREPGSDHRQVLGPDRWQKGRVYVDVQTYTLPADVTGATVTILVGIWKAEARLRVIRGANDGDNSAIVGHISTGLTAPSP